METCMEDNVCRVCMISSEVIDYFNLMTKKIFKNILLYDAFKLITDLDVAADDGFPLVVCSQCEKQLQNSYHFRQLAESSSRHFAMIRQKKSINQSTTPKILKVNSENTETDTIVFQFDNSDEQQIDIDQNRVESDVDVKPEIEDIETFPASPVVYVVNVNDTDGAIGVMRPNTLRSNYSLRSPPANALLSKQCTSSTYSQSGVKSSERKLNTNTMEKRNVATIDQLDAISFLLQEKHLKNDDGIKDPAYRNRKNVCTVCGKKFIGKSNLVDHLRYHANIRNYKCKFCGKTFVQSGSLKSHIKTHTLERPYICKYCTKTFRQNSALTVHIRTHTQERKFTCDVCSKAFMTTGDLVRHKFIHEKVKRFACDVCGKRSAQKVNIKKHKLKIHGISV